jgi:hypothetical protein
MVCTDIEAAPSRSVCFRARTSSLSTRENLTPLHPSMTDAISRFTVTTTREWEARSAELPSPSVWATATAHSRQAVKSSVKLRWELVDHVRLEIEEVFVV